MPKGSISRIISIDIYMIYIYTNKAREICLRDPFLETRVCPEWPAMPCMEWLPALGIQQWRSQDNLVRRAQLRAPRKCF